MDALVDKLATADDKTLHAFTRCKPFPENLPREHVVVESPFRCTRRGSDHVVKVDKDITETLERHPASMKGDPDRPRKVQLPDREKISQPAASLHANPRGWLRPQQIAMVALNKYGHHQRLNRKCWRTGRERVVLSLSTLSPI